MQRAHNYSGRVLFYLMAYNDKIQGLQMKNKNPNDLENKYEGKKNIYLHKCQKALQNPKIGQEKGLQYPTPNCTKKLIKKIKIKHIFTQDRQNHKK